MTFEYYQKKIQQGLGMRRSLRNKSKELTEAAQEGVIYLEAVERAQALLQQVAQDTQNKVKYHIEDVVQLGLDTVFPNEYQFKLAFEIKRNRTEARLVLEKDEKEIKPMDATGGGVIDIIAFALRIAVWSLSNTAPFLVLDEPMKNIRGRNLFPLAAEVIRTLAKRLKIQIIMVSHDDELKEIADKHFKITKKNGISIVSENNA